MHGDVVQISYLPGRMALVSGGDGIPREQTGFLK